MKIKQLIAHLPIVVYRGSQDIDISGLCCHSKRVAPGNLFIAKKGTIDDGGRYIEEALEAGAVAILTDLPNPFLKGVVQLIHPQVAEMESQLAAHFYGYPSRQLFTVGVTGTNGKTTITYLVKHLFDALGWRCGLLGTIEYLLGDHSMAADRTTPDAIANQKFLKEMVKQKCVAAVMEATSHGLIQGRCDQIDFDVGVFSNLTQDHLDYHGSMEQYALAKSRLFNSLAPDKYAIVNGHSPWLSILLSQCRAKVFSYGFSGKENVYAENIQLGFQKSEFTVCYQGEKVAFTTSLIGRFNILNCLAAIAVCLVRGVSLQILAPLVASFHSVPGRLERVRNRKGLNVFVDYAHTPDALEQVLHALQEIKQGRILTVFGCGGDRDRGKRPLMGSAAEKGSDFTWITSDNPRSEDPHLICQEIATGFTSSRYEIQVDRKAAIAKALALATPKDLILIAGKGHETYQLFAHQTLSFDDRLVAQEIADDE